MKALVLYKLELKNDANLCCRMPTVVKGSHSKNEDIAAPTLHGNPGMATGGASAKESVIQPNGWTKGYG